MTFRISMTEKVRSEMDWRQARSERHRRTKKSWNISASKTFHNRFFRSTFRPCIRNQLKQYQTTLVCPLSSHKTFGKSNRALWSFPDEPWSFWPAGKQPFWILAPICILSFLSNLIATAIADYIQITSKIKYNFVTCKMQKYTSSFIFCSKTAQNFCGGMPFCPSCVRLNSALLNCVISLLRKS